MNRQSLKVFYSYSQLDDLPRLDLYNQLHPLRKKEWISEWWEGKILAGDEWEESIIRQLEAADIIIILISVNFLTSERCYSELKKSIKRHNNGTAIVIPVMIKHCNWSDEPFAKLAMVPTDAKPLDSYLNKDEAYASAAKMIIDKVSDIVAFDNSQHKDTDNLTSENKALKSFLSQNTDKELEKLIENYFNFKKINNKLYVKVLGNWIEELNRKADIWKSGEIHMTRDETFTKGVLIFRNLEKGGFATYYAPISEYWNEEDTYLMEARKAGRRGCKIARVYILRDIRILFNEDFREQINDDINADFDVRIAFYEDIPESARKDFGIWDEEVLCIVETRAISALKEEVTGGKLSINLKDLNNAKKWKDEILLCSHEAPKVIAMINQLSEEKIYLFQSMLEMEKLSSLYCKTSYIDEYNCSWYHNSWQYLRLLDLVSSPFWHTDFYSSQLSIFNDEAKTDLVNRTKKILISGTADYAILEMLYDSFKENIKIEIDIVDRCDTPLEICKWYSNKNKPTHILNVNISRQDIRNTNFQPDYFDLIITDAFLTRFKNEEKQNVINEWTRILKPMGKIITTVRMDKSNIPTPIKAKKSEAEDFVIRARQKIDEFEPLLNNLSKSIINKAGEYARNMDSHSFKSDHEISLLFSDFHLICEEKETVGEFDGKTTYLRIVAEKKCPLVESRENL